MKITRVYPKNGRWYYAEDLEELGKNGRPKQKWHGLTRIDEGDAALTAKLAEILGEVKVEDGGMKAHLEEFKKVHLPTLSPLAQKEYERMYAVIGKAFARFDSPEVEAGDVEKFLTNFANKPNTRGKYKARLSTFFSWCVRNSHTGVKINPCREIRLSGPLKKRGKMTAAIFWAYHDALTELGKCVLTLCYLTRQRPKDIRLLRESNIGPEYIDFTPFKTIKSTGAEVRVRRTQDIDYWLDRARSLRPKLRVSPIDPYIIQSRTGEAYSKNGFYELWRDAGDKNGHKGVTTLHIRPYALSAMEELGAEVRVIQKAAAHASITTTEGYLEQHRENLSDFRLPLPDRPKT